ncbi:tripartite motif-containing protein 12A-like [Dreissena polymorpha]|uniref:Uncharacterized protein n=1 Tax=Dreissena polymorpha TaxID=45954 RepID=A0A9D4KZ11_DREPO|nr:tripartite motif-containing protein 12A-like [Dreissena polymorpha]KAH3848752.1 hypothetical protein DPMN_091132 [Dreissena polymorpha]
MATGWNRDCVPNLGNSLFWKKLECPLCDQVFTNPKDLECGHTFCDLCLKKLIAKNASCKNITCPTCKNITYPSLRSKNTADLVKGLKTNIAVQELVRCFQPEASDPDEDVLHKSSDGEGTIISTYDDDTESFMCSTHRRMPFKFFCPNHSLLMCDFCKKVHGKSCRRFVLIEDHATPEVVKAVTCTQQQEISQMKSKLKTALKNLIVNRIQLKTQFEEYSAQLSDIEKDLKKLFVKLKSKLKAETFESITNQQQEQISEIKNLLAVIDFKTNELQQIGDYRDYSDRFMRLVINKDQTVVIESSVTAVTETLTSVRMRHVGIDVMTSFLKLGGEYLGEVQFKPTKLEHRKSV